jgi:hypothetical protein
MKPGDLEFHQQKEPIIEAIATEGLRIARDNEWHGLVIEIEVSREGLPGTKVGVRCWLRSKGGEPELDEPTGSMLDAARHLQELFSSVGTPLAGAAIEWIEGESVGTFRRKCSYRYH